MYTEYRAFLARLPKPDEFRTELDLARGKDPVAGVYILLDGSVPVYVGHSGYLQDRLRCHRRDSSKIFNTLIFYPLDNVLSRLILEGILILGLRPKYNRALSLGLSPDNVWELKYNVPKNKTTTSQRQRPAIGRHTTANKRRPGATKKAKKEGIAHLGKGVAEGA